MTSLENAREITTQDLMALGLTDVAYVKSVTQGDTELFAIHAADGRQVALLPNRKAAETTIRQNNLEPVSVH
ncbi:MAG: DUF1150 family protein [Pseudomonadota bacterium]